MSGEKKVAVSGRVQPELAQFLVDRAELHKREGRDTDTVSDQLAIAIQRLRLADMTPAERALVQERLDVRRVEKPAGPVAEQGSFDDLGASE